MPPPSEKSRLPSPDDPADPTGAAAAFAGATVHTYTGTRKSKRLMWRLLDIQEGDSVLVLPGGKTIIASATQLDAIRKPDA